MDKKDEEQTSRNKKTPFSLNFIRLCFFFEVFYSLFDGANLERSTKSLSNSTFLSSTIRYAQSTNFTYKDHDMVISVK